MIPTNVKTFAAVGLTAAFLLVGASAAQAQSSTPSACTTNWNISAAKRVCDNPVVTGTITTVTGDNGLDTTTISCTVNADCPLHTPNPAGTGSTMTWNATSYTGPPGEIANLCNSVSDTIGAGGQPLSTGTLVQC